MMIRGTAHAWRSICLAALALIAALLSACTGGTLTPLPTQTPIYLIVTGEEPARGADQPAATGSPEIFPTPYACRAEVVEQAFESGRMFWVGRTFEERCRESHEFAPGSGEIWVAIFDEGADDQGIWLAFTDDWNSDTEIPFDLTMTQPAGLLQPVRGFGKVWREKLTGEQRARIGWATSPEIKFITTYRYDAGGMVDRSGVYVPRPGQHTLETFGGEKFFLDEQTGRFEFIPSD